MLKVQLVHSPKEQNVIELKYGLLVNTRHDDEILHGLELHQGTF